MKSWNEVKDASTNQILAWADAHQARTGQWPMAESGPIPEAPDETWSKVNSALRNGTRGFLGALSSTSSGGFLAGG